MRWHGTLAEVVEVCKEVEVTFRDSTGSAQDYRAEARFRGGSSRELTSLTEIEQISDRDLATLRKLNIAITPTGHSFTPYFFVEFDDAWPAAFFSLKGHDRDRINELANRLEAMLKGGAPWPQIPSSWIAWLAAAVGTVVELALVYDVIFPALWALHWAVQDDKWDPAELAAVGAMGAVLVGLYLLMRRLTPNLELVRATH
jgi:hypothetical protein